MKKRTKRKIKKFVLKSIAIIATFNLMLFGSAIDSLTTEGLFLGFIVNGIGFIYLTLLAYANGWIYDTDPYYKRITKEALQH